MRIKAQTVKRPYRLSEVARFFDIKQDILLDRLKQLAAEQKVFQHDIKSINSGTDYWISGYAAALVIIEFEQSEEAANHMAEFCRVFEMEEKTNTGFLVKSYADAWQYRIQQAAALIRATAEDMKEQAQQAEGPVH